MIMNKFHIDQIVYYGNIPVRIVRINHIDQAVLRDGSRVNCDVWQYTTVMKDGTLEVPEDALSTYPTVWKSKH